MLIRTALIAIGLGILACASPVIQLTPAAERVEVGRSDPSDNYEFIGGVTARDGNGCGLYGRRGNYDNAVTALRVKAAKLGADYVSIMTITQPHMANPKCFSNPYIISGMAYRRISDSPSPVKIQNVAMPEGELGLVGKLSELHRLHQAGALTDAEYERAKARLLE